jgi:hypothetical protein
LPSRRKIQINARDTQAPGNQPAIRNFGAWLKAFRFDKPVGRDFLRRRLLIPA